MTIVHCFMTILRYWKTILVAVVILYVSLLREPCFSLPPIDCADKWAHLLAYALLGAVAHWDSRRIELKRYVVLIAIVLPILYGGALELVQELWFYPRTGDWLDWAVDAIGVVLGYLLISIALCTYQKLMNPTDE